MDLVQDYILKMLDETPMPADRERLIRCAVTAYAKALEDPKAQIPTYLHAALEALRRV